MASYHKVLNAVEEEVNNLDAPIPDINMRIAEVIRRYLDGERDITSTVRDLEILMGRVGGRESFVKSVEERLEGK